MKQILHLIQTDKITSRNYSGNPQLIDNQKRYWLELKKQTGQNFSNELKKLDLPERILEHVNTSEETVETVVYGNTFILKLDVSKTSDIYSKDYLTLIFKPGLLITILDEKNTIFENFADEINKNPYHFELDNAYIIYYMISQILYQSTLNVKKARNKVDQLSLTIDEEPEELEVSDIIQVKHKINQLANIIEDQHTTLELVPKINWSEDLYKIELEISKLIDRFEFLQNSVNRLEEKVREIQLYSQLIFQEKSNKKLNTLTVIQSIFVPLTFIAGIYGMNFKFMPELSWRNGYFIILGIMLVIALFELVFFKRKGWFD